MGTSTKRYAASTEERVVERLGRCHGFAVYVDGTPIGFVETPLFPGLARDPDYVLVRTSSALAGTYRVVSTALIDGIDVARRHIRLSLDAEGVGALPERLPLVGR